MPTRRTAAYNKNKDFMSKQSAGDYLKRIDEDEDLKKLVTNAGDNHVREVIIKKAGFDFTKDELREALKEEIAKGFKDRRKLTDAELAEITGGSA